jgi:hypothetical protein
VEALTILEEDNNMKEYIVEPIGAQFSDSALTSLAQRFSSRAGEGYELQLVFQVSQPGCLGIGQGSITYLAVYAKEH